MTPRRRQLFAWSALLFFLIVSTGVVLTVSGWRWAGWRQGFIPTGVIVITSSPKADVTLNGQAKGSTPRRMSGLPAGTYTLALSSSKGTWQQTIQLQARQAVVIGPVTLFPSTPTVTTLGQFSADQILTDQSGRYVFRRTGPTTAQEAWPRAKGLNLTWSGDVSNLVISPHEQEIALTTSTGLLLEGHGQTWAVPLTDHLFWLPDSDQVVYGLRNGQLIALDTLRQTEQVLGPANQAGVFDQDLWRLISTPTQTYIVRQPPQTAAAVQEIWREDGDWTANSGPGKSLVLRQKQSGDTLLLTQTATGLVRQSDLGQTDNVWWNAGQPPLWSRGAELWTRGKNDLPMLLDRRAQPPMLAAWIHSPDILLTVDVTGLLISSVSPTQGRGTVTTGSLQSAQHVIAFDINRHQAVVQDAESVEVWSW